MQDNIESGFIFLDIAHPLVAWECYRGKLVSPYSVHDDENFHPSIMMANTIYANNNVKILNELFFESVRFNKFPDSVSRLKAVYAFKDESSIKKAIAWGDHFSRENLAEVEIQAVNITKVDANWITYAQRHSNGIIKAEYIPHIHHYWAGEIYPDSDPQWEYLINGNVTICGTELREKAYKNIKKLMPDALELLEIARIGAILGSNIGHIVPYIHRVSITKFKLVRIPLMPITDSTSSRSRIPFDADRVFHSMAIKPERSDAVFSL